MGQNQYILETYNIGIETPPEELGVCVNCVMREIGFKKKFKSLTPKLGKLNWSLNPKWRHSYEIWQKDEVWSVDWKKF